MQSYSTQVLCHGVWHYAKFQWLSFSLLLPSCWKYLDNLNNHAGLKQTIKKTHLRLILCDLQIFHSEFNEMIKGNLITRLGFTPTFFQLFQHLTVFLWLIFDMQCSKRNDSFLLCSGCITYWCKIQIIYILEEIDTQMSWNRNMFKCFTVT